MLSVEDVDCSFTNNSQEKTWALIKAYKFTLKAEKLFWTLKSQDFFLKWKTKNLKFKDRCNYTVRKRLYSLSGFDVGVLMKESNFSIFMAIT